MHPAELHLCAKTPTCTADKPLRPTLVLVGGKEGCPRYPASNDVDTKADSRLACQDALLLTRALIGLWWNPKGPGDGRPWVPQSLDLGHTFPSSS